MVSLLYRVEVRILTKLLSEPFWRQFETNEISTFNGHTFTTKDSLRVYSNTQTRRFEVMLKCDIGSI